MKSVYQDLFNHLEDLKNQGQFRELRKLENRNGKWIDYQNKRFLNCSSNDYLGVAGDRAIQKDFFSYLHSFDENMIDLGGLSSSSSRLLTGNSPMYNELESQLAFFYEREAALVFNSGYHANIGIISALAGPGDVIFSDKLNHASIIDGLKLSGADFYRYRHNELNHLEDILEKKRGNYNRAIIITESVFSMDGDRASLKELTQIKEAHNCLLIVDEAHGVGALGKTGMGLCELEEEYKNIDIIVGTFGKALGGLGAYAIMEGVVRDYLINTMRPFIFTTALPPMQLHWNLFVLKKIPSMEKERLHLLSLSQYLRKELEDMGLETRGNSQIVPVIVGENDKTLEMAEALQAEGFLIFPIRPPTVPKGTSRLRISLMASMLLEDIEKMVHCFKKLV